MKYQQPTFTVGQPSRVTACPACVYGEKEHAAWCDSGRFIAYMHRSLAAACGEMAIYDDSWFRCPVTISEAVPPNEVWIAGNREQRESEAEWLKRSGVILNVGKPTQE